MTAVPILRLNPNAHIPTHGTPCSAGSDLYACLKGIESAFGLDSMVISAKKRNIIPTGISVAIPEGYYGRIAPRSSLAAKHGLDVGAGVIDSDYRGEVKVVLFNHSSEDYVIKHGDRIAQLIVTPYASPEFIEVFHLVPTERKGGFGSTGK